MSRSMLTDLDFGGAARATSLLDPASAQDAATKAYVDSAITGLNWKDSVRAASTANVTITGPGATIDGVTMAANDRVLLKDQSTASQNGLYIWNGSAVSMTRTTDMDSAPEVEQAVVLVEEGTTNAGTTWRQTAVNVTLGTTSLAWTAFGTAAPSASTTQQGIVELADQTETDTGTDNTRAVTPQGLANYSGRKKKFTATFGDGSATTYNIDHNFATKDVIVEVYKNSGNNDTVLCDVTRTTTNRVVLTFAAAVASNALNVVVIA
jgi:hypothetical protein